MDKRKLLISYGLQALAIVTLFIMFMPIVKSGSATMVVFEQVIKAGQWVYMEEYLFGIAGLITTICLPILIVSLEVCKLSAVGIIKSKTVDLICYIVNIVLTSCVAGVIVNYFLGLGRTMGMSGLVLFKGPTMFKYSTAFFYLHCIFAAAMVVGACFNRTKKSK